MVRRQLREEIPRAVRQVAPQPADVLEGGRRQEVARREAVAPLTPAVERAHQSDVVGARASCQVALGLVRLALLVRLRVGARAGVRARVRVWVRGRVWVRVRVRSASRSLPSGQRKGLL